MGSLPAAEDALLRAGRMTDEQAVGLIGTEVRLMMSAPPSIAAWTPRATSKVEVLSYWP